MECPKQQKLNIIFAKKVTLYNKSLICKLSPPAVIQPGGIAEHGGCLRCSAGSGGSEGAAGPVALTRVQMQQDGGTGEQMAPGQGKWKPDCPIDDDQQWWMGVGLPPGS